MKNLSAEQVGQKWQRNASNAGQDYATGIASVTENPMAKAAAAADLWQQRVAQPEAKQKFVRKLNGASFEAWKQIAASSGASRYTQGVSDKVVKYTTAIGPVLAYERNLAAQIAPMPKATQADRENRMLAWSRGMAKFSGQA